VLIALRKATESESLSQGNVATRVGIFRLLLNYTPFIQRSETSAQDHTHPLPLLCQLRHPWCLFHGRQQLRWRLRVVRWALPQPYRFQESQRHAEKRLRSNCHCKKGEKSRFIHLRERQPTAAQLTQMKIRGFWPLLQSVLIRIRTGGVHSRAMSPALLKLISYQI